MASLPYPLSHDCTANLVGMARMPYPPICKDNSELLLLDHFRVSKEDIRIKHNTRGRKETPAPRIRLYMCQFGYFHIDFIVRTRPVAGLPLMVMLLYILLGYTSKVCAMDPLPVNNSTDDWSI